MIPNKAYTYENIYMNGIIFLKLDNTTHNYIPANSGYMLSLRFCFNLPINKTAPPAVNKIFATQKL